MSKAFKSISQGLKEAIEFSKGNTKTARIIRQKPTKYEKILDIIKRLIYVKKSI